MGRDNVCAGPCGCWDVIGGKRGAKRSSDGLVRVTWGEICHNK